MLNEKKIILMSKMAIYEKNEGKQHFKASKYFSDDYVGMNMINTALIATFLFFIMIGAYLLANIDEFLEDITIDNILSKGKTAAVLYLIFLGIYLVISYIFYSIKYKKTKDKLKNYDQDLKELYRLCKQERKMKENLWQEGKDNDEALRIKG